MPHTPNSQRRFAARPRALVCHTNVMQDVLATELDLLYFRSPPHPIFDGRAVGVLAGPFFASLWPIIKHVAAWPFTEGLAPSSFGKTDIPPSRRSCCSKKCMYRRGVGGTSCNCIDVHRDEGNGRGCTASATLLFNDKSLPDDGFGQGTRPAAFTYR